jgi:hypothetical protein
VLFRHGFPEPSFHLAAQFACINNLRQLDGAKQQWALENKAAASAAPALTDTQPYLGRGTGGTSPTCPARDQEHRHELCDQRRLYSSHLLHQHESRVGVSG